MRILTIKTDWYDNNKNLLITEVSEDWNWNDVQVNAQMLHDLAMSVTYPIALIVLLPRTMSIPPTGFVQHSRDVIANHSKLGIHTIVYVTRTPYTITLWQETINALAQDNSRYFIADSADDALHIVNSRAS